MINTTRGISVNLKEFEESAVGNRSEVQEAATNGTSQHGLQAMGRHRLHGHLETPPGQQTETVEPRTPSVLKI